MTEQESILAEIVEELKSTPPKTKRKRRTKAEIAQADSTAIAVIEVELATEAERWAQEAKDQLEVIAMCEIETQSDMDEMGQMQRAAFEKVKELTEKRLGLTRPIDAAKKGVMDLFKPALGFYEAIEAAAKKKIEAFRLEAAKAQDLALAAVAASGGEADRDTLVLAHGGRLLALPETSREVVSWKHTIWDTSQLPDWCWKRSIDYDAINAHVAAKGAEANIPGVKVERVVTIANKAVRS